VSETAIRSERHGPVEVIVIDHPPVNALAQPLRAALLAAVEAAEADPAVSAIVIHGAGRHFVAGADIREFDHEPRAPLLNDVLLRIEAAAKPVIAALHGAVLGGGFELALACHYRLAAPDVSFGLPEIRLGLLPGSGGTQRLPRLIGATPALELMLSGDPIDLARARALDIVDGESGVLDLLELACGFAPTVEAADLEARRLCNRTVAGGTPDPEWVARARAAAKRKFPGVASVDAIIDCVAAACSEPFGTALALSRRRFEECRRSEASRALRHLFFAEREPKSAAAPGAAAPPEATPRSVRSVGVVGSGTMGAGIAANLATAGFSVTLVDSDERALAAGMERVRGVLAAGVERGRLDASAAAAAGERIRAARAIEALAAADLVIEAVFESLPVKAELFAQLGALCAPGAVLATNTSTLDVDAIASSSRRADAVVGMHFFSPAHIMRLVEIVRGRDTSPDVIETARSVARRMGKLGIVVGNCFGFVGNRMLYAYGRENQLLLLEGASPPQIDAALESFGMAMGPNAVGDLAGLDVGYRVRRERKDLPDDPRYYRVADLLVEAGRLGQKTGRGAYLYPQGARHRVSDPEVEAMIAAEAGRLGIERRAISDEDIRRRCLFALINEGARLLGEGIAAVPGDIDAIWCNGYGFPRFRGGPMFYADSLGPAVVLDGVHRFAETLGRRYWTPAPLLEELVRSGGTFQAWRAGARREESGA
jgi:3-hydroxyacyl-CoA dehydrogenase